MPKQGMARPDWTKAPKNAVPPVPEIQGKAKHGKEKAAPIIAGTGGPGLKVYHTPPHASASMIVDTDLGRDNLENDIPAADLEDFTW